MTDDERATIDPPRAIRVKTSTGWADLAFQGPVGGQGPAGPAGPTGPQGPKGDPGAGVPSPVVNGQFVKGVGGAAVWAAIAATDLPAQAVPTYGTTFPASPADGAEHVLVDGVANPAFTWRFRYNAGSTSPFKWEFVGGAPLIGASAGAVSNGGTLNTWLNLVASTLTVPRSGEFRVQANCSVSHPTANATMYAGLYAGTASNVFAYSLFGFPVAGGYSGTIPVGPTRIALNAGQALGMAGQANVASGTWSNLGWEMVPVRVQ
jgi:hypothetical protein